MPEATAAADPNIEPNIDPNIDPSVEPNVDPDTQPASAATRRCWRCLQMFACPPDEVSSRHAEWWLCDPCHHTLLGERRTRL